MLFHKFLRALLEAWGHKPKGTTVWELLKEVLQNLPFGTKTEMVEIVPEQSVTGEFNEEDGVNSISLETNIPLEQRDNLKSLEVTFNGVKYECDFIIDEYGDRYAGAPWGDFSKYPFTIYAGGYNEDPNVYLDINWSAELGETITLAIYEEKETVTPLDPKFVGGVSVYTYDSDEEFIDDDSVLYLYHFDVETQTAGEKVSKEELATAFSKGVIYVTNQTINTIELSGYSSNEMVINVSLDPNKDSGSVRWLDSITINGKYHTAHTKEFVQSTSGPPV